jgi:hypothetical protein
LGTLAIGTTFDAGGEDVEGQRQMRRGARGFAIAPRPCQARQAHAARAGDAVQQPAILLWYHTGATAPALRSSRQEAPQHAGSPIGGVKVEHKSSFCTLVARFTLFVDFCRFHIAQGAA